VDEKRRHADGSLRHAVISMVLPSGAATGAVLELSAVHGPAGQRAPEPAQDPRALLGSDFDVVVRFRFAEGKQTTVSARELIDKTGEGAPTWLSGHAVTEWIVAGAGDQDIRVEFSLRAYPAAQAVRVSVSIENCWDHWAGNVGYDIQVALGKGSSRPIWSKQGVNHLPLSRWRKVFWWPKAPAEAEACYQPGYLQSTLAVGNYDPAVQVPESILAGEVARKWQAAPKDLLEPGTVSLYMPATGGREDIGPLPTWTVRWLCSMDSRARAQMLGNGDLAGSWPIHIRAGKTRRIMTLEERPNFWILPRGEDFPRFQPDRAPRPKPPKFSYEPDIAHLPALANVPYLVTGDYWLLEEMMFWANYGLLNQWPSPRQGARGLIHGNQVRAQAWALRDLADAAWIVPDDWPEKTYFDTRVKNNLAYYNQAFYGPPERSLMGWWGELNPADNRIAGGKSRIWFTCPWQNDFLAWSFGHLVERGYANAAKARDYLLRNTVGRYTSAPDFPPEGGAPYYLACGRAGSDGKLNYFPDWKTVFHESWNSPEGWRQPDWLKGGKPAVWDDYGSSYFFIARGAIVLGVDGGTPKAAEALAWIDSHSSNRARTMAVDPTWTFVPRTRIAGK
jgi:hypothetical protein